MTKQRIFAATLFFMGTSVIPILALANSNGDSEVAQPGASPDWAHRPNQSRVYDAVVDATGTLIRGSATAAFQLGVSGNYEVDFSRNVTNCAYTATIGNAGAGNPAPGFIVTAARSGVANGVFIQTFDLSGQIVGAASAPYPFHLVVAC